MEEVKQRAWLSIAEAGAPGVRTLLWDFLLARDRTQSAPRFPVEGVLADSRKESCCHQNLPE